MEPRIGQSPELLAVLDRWQEAMRTRSERTIVNLLSRDASLRYVGSAMGEIWGGDLLRAGFAEHVREIPDFTYDPHIVEAYQYGECGWGLWAGFLKFDGVAEPSFNRFSFVFALEDGAWRIVQMHCSNPIPNLEKIGVEQHAMDALVKKAREGFRLDQREGVATIMFTDIVDSTQLASVSGDRLWASRIAGHFEMIAEAVNAEGGQVVKSLGDGTMSSFPTPGGALAAARTVQRTIAGDVTVPPFFVRIGLHCGDVIQTKDDFFGHVVNKAARISATAGAGEVRVSDAIRMLAAGEEFSFVSPALAALKGFAEDELTHLLEWHE
jgi:class 3 adenylate cyclase